MKFVQNVMKNAWVLAFTAPAIFISSQAFAYTYQDYLDALNLVSYDEQVVSGLEGQASAIPDLFSLQNTYDNAYRDCGMQSNPSDINDCRDAALNDLNTAIAERETEIGIINSLLAEAQTTLINDRNQAEYIGAHIS